MTARQVFEATLIELSKIQAPSLKLYEFNYLFNKAINQYINKVYNVYDINQQTTDDLRVLKSTAYLTPTKFGYPNNVGPNKPFSAGAEVTVNNNKISNSASSYLSTQHRSIQSLHGATYEVEMPLDYLHMLNCVCIYYVAKQKDCWDAGSFIEVPATRLTADSWSQIVTDIYNRPSPMKPYYYIHNISGDTDFKHIYHVTTNGGPVTENEGIEIGTDKNITNDGTNDVTGEKSNFNRTFELKSGVNASVVEKPIASRMGNASKVRCEIRYGKDDTLFQLAEVHVDYVKVPQHIRLTQEQIDLTEDTSQIMEFPDYVNQEIINELVHLVMERTADPRLGSNIQMSQSIARPTQQQQQPAQQAQ